MSEISMRQLWRTGAAALGEQRVASCVAGPSRQAIDRLAEPQRHSGCPEGRPIVELGLSSMRLTAQSKGV
jgi:hypothetical protein